MKRIFFLILVSFAIGFIGKAEYPKVKRYIYQHTDSYAREMAVLIKSDVGSCTGVKVIAPSGKSYILTAGHCHDLAPDGNFPIFDEGGRKHIEKFIDESPTQDIMLLSNDDGQGVSVAKSTRRFDDIHTMTHGKGRPAYRTDGTLLMDEIQQFINKQIESPEDVAKCQSKPKYKISLSMFGLVCITEVKLTISTAQVVPGSSGGPVFNIHNELIGTVVGTDGFFSSFVPLADLQKYLLKR